MHPEIKSSIHLFLGIVGILALCLFIIFSITGGITAPIYSDLLSKCVGSRLFGSCTTYADFYKLFLVTAYSLVASLIVALPVFYLFGFKTKRKILLATVATIIASTLFHLARFIFDGVSSIVGTILVMVFESLFLLLRLKAGMSREKIIIAVVVANLVLFILIRVFGEFMFIPVPFFLTNYSTKLRNK